MDERRSERKKWVGVILVYAGLLALDIWIYFVVPSTPWLSRVAFVFQMIGVFGLATGFIATTEISKCFSSLLEDLTAPNLRNFVGGNLAFTAILMFVLSFLFSGVLHSKRLSTGLALSLFYFISLPVV